MNGKKVIKLNEVCSIWIPTLKMQTKTIYREGKHNWNLVCSKHHHDYNNHLYFQVSTKTSYVSHEMEKVYCINHHTQALHLTSVEPPLSNLLYQTYANLQAWTPTTSTTNGHRQQGPPSLPPMEDLMNFGPPPWPAMEHLINELRPTCKNTKQVKNHHTHNISYVTGVTLFIAPTPVT